MTRTTIAVVSSDRGHLDAIARALKADPHVDVSTIEGGSRELKAMGAPPDVIIVNGKAVDEGGLDSLERLGRAHPGTAFIVVTENQSPEFFRSAMRAGVREVLPCPVPADQLLHAVERLKRRHDAASACGKVVAFIPAKGGSGATFLATNLGYVLADGGHSKVLLLDLNLQFGDAALFVTAEQPGMDLAEVAREIHRIDSVLLSASVLNVLPTYGLLPAPQDPAQSVDVKAEHVEKIISIAREQYDFVILDLGRSLDAVTLRALDLADLIFPVVQIGLPYIHDGKRLLGVLRSLGYSSAKINVIMNRHEKGREIGISDVEKALGVKVFRTIPNSYHATADSVNQGVSIAKLSKGNPVTRSLVELAAVVAPRATRAESGWLSKVLGLS
jgi:pilus assembly protein CpaE